MKSYLKFLFRNKLYTAIEAVGLIVSLAFVILIGNYVRQQWLVARGAPEWKHYYAVGSTYENVDMAPAGLAWLIKENVPGVDKATMYQYFAMSSCRIGSEPVRNEKIIYVEPDFLDMFQVEWIEGNSSALLEKGGIAVHERIARLFDGDRSVLEQQMFYQDTLNIVSVFRSLGQPLFEDPGFLRVREEKVLSRVSMGGSTVLLSSSMPEEELTMVLDRAMEEHARKGFGRDESRQFKNGSIVRMDRLYFSDLQMGQAFYKGNASLLKMLLAVVLLLLLSAVFNYINLSSALAGRRTKEMGMRAILGASRWQIVRSYLIESLVFTAVCAGLAVLLAHAFKPVLARYVDTMNGSLTVSVPFAWQRDGFSLFLLSAITLTVGLLSGWIPARMASRYDHVQIVKGDYRLRSKRLFSKVFIIFQTALSVILIAFALVMERQYAYMIHRPLGADVDGLYVQTLVSDAQKDAVSQMPFVSEVGRTRGYPGAPYMIVGTPGPDGSETLFVGIVTCDSTAFRMYDFEVVEDFHLPSGAGVWLSESAFNGFGLRPGDTAIPEWVHMFEGKPLAGIVKDFATSDAAHVDPSRWGAVLVEEALEGGNLLLRIDGDRKEAEGRLAESYTQFSTERYGYDFYPELNRFISDKLKEGLSEAENYMRLIELFMALAVLVSLLGLLAMSIFFASEQTRDVAVRKVFGGTIGSEVAYGVREYMLLVGIACVIAVPVAVWLSSRYLEDFVYRISGYGWIFAVAVVITLLISLASVFWQVLKAARTNPAIELKKE